MLGRGWATALGVSLAVFSWTTSACRNENPLGHFLIDLSETFDSKLSQQARNKTHSASKKQPVGVPLANTAGSTSANAGPGQCFCSHAYNLRVPSHRRSLSAQEKGTPLLRSIMSVTAL